MSYLAFLLLFLVLPVLVLAVTVPRPLGGRGGQRARWSLPLIGLVALVYTTPWDNYLVYRGVWRYGAERVLFTIGYVPLEEYLFFLLQPLLTGLVLYHLLPRVEEAPVRAPEHIRWGGAVACGLLSVIGVLLLTIGSPHALYLGLILAWAGPVLAGLWAWGGPLIWRLRRAFLPGVLLSTLYLWAADRIALALGIWSISDRYSLDIDPLGLPIEEAVFFLLTNLLVGQGLIAFLHGDRIGNEQLVTRNEVLRRGRANE